MAPTAPSLITADSRTDSKFSIEHIESAALEKGRKQRLQTVDEDDKAAAIVNDGEKVEYSLEDDRRVLRKIDTWVLIPLVLVYFLQQLDKSSLSYTSVFGIVQEAKLVGKQYSWLSSCVYLAQLVFQPINVWALTFVPVNRWILFNLVAWGATVAGSAAAHNFTGLIIARTLLGIFEASVAPTFIFITQRWWRRREQTYRTMAWNASNAIAGTLGPLTAFGIGHINTSALKPYQAIFLFCGCLTVGLAPIVFFMLPESPTTAKFLRHGDDRRIAIERLRANNTGVESHKFKWEQFFETFRDPKTYLWFSLLFLAALPSGGIGAFGGLILLEFTTDKFQTILLQMPFGVVSFLSICLGGYLTNRFKLRFPVIVGATVFPIIGASMLMALPRGPGSRGSLLAAYYLVSVLACIQPLLYSWSNLNAAGHTKKVTNTACLFVAQCVGNVVGPLVYKIEEKPYYRTGLKVDLICWCLLAGVALFTGVYLKYLNRKQEQRREALGRQKKLVDTSIMSVKEAAAHKAQHADEVGENEHAFHDLTDFENADFIYVI